MHIKIYPPMNVISLADVDITRYTHMQQSIVLLLYNFRHFFLNDFNLSIVTYDFNPTPLMFQYTRIKSLISMFSTLL